MAQKQKHTLAIGRVFEDDEPTQSDLYEATTHASTQRLFSLRHEAPSEETKELAKSLVDTLKGLIAHFEKTSERQLGDIERERKKAADRKV